MLIDKRNISKRKREEKEREASRLAFLTQKNIANFKDDVFKSNFNNILLNYLYFYSTYIFN